MTNYRHHRNQNSFTFLDLFCGAGGLTLGFEQGGFQCLGAADWEQAALATHRQNFSAPAWRVDLAEALPFQVPQLDVVIGGPPCQGFPLPECARWGMGATI